MSPVLPVFLVALTACRSGPVDLTPPGTPPIGPSGKRPLCKEERTAPGPRFALDLTAWATWLVESDNRYFGEWEWRDLEALGEDRLGASSAEEGANRLLRGWYRLKFGDIDGAIDDFTKAEALAAADDGATALERSRQLLGAAWMRKAETVNCVEKGTGESCIVPFGSGAIHADPTLMASASSAFERALAANPDEPSVLWLDNVSYMARGEWPEAVPSEYSLPDGFLDSEAPAVTWPNVLPGLGVTEPTLAGGAAIEDFDGDGRLDVMVSSLAGQDGMDLYLNEGDGGFCVASNASGVSSIPGLLSFTVVDYDNDGDMDVFGPRAAWMGAQGAIRPSLLRNDGEGRFVDVARAAGLDDPAVNGATQVAVVGDVDNDGWVDVFVGRESEPANPWVSSLYRGRPDGTFVDTAAEVGLSDVGFVKGAELLDYDRDGDLDLYVSVFGGENGLYEQLDDGTFVDRAVEYGVTEPIRSFPVARLDYDQDGREDLFVASFSANYAGGGPLDPTYFRSLEAWLLDRLGEPPAPDTPSETPHLYRNTPTGFVDVTEEVGLDDVHATMGLTIGDFDADSFPDLLLGTGAPEFDALEPKAAYRNDGGARFLDVTPDIGMGSIQKGHGVAFGDLDEDGDEDALLELGGAFPVDVAPNQLFVNPQNEGDHFHRHTVILRLVGVTVNRSALHARVRVVTASRDRWHVVGEGGSFGNTSLQLEVGLGEDDAIERVVIDWPGAETEVVDDVPVDSVVTLRQGEGVVDARPYAPFVIDGSAGAHVHDDDPLELIPQRD